MQKGSGTSLTISVRLIGSINQSSVLLMSRLIIASFKDLIGDMVISYLYVVDMKPFFRNTYFELQGQHWPVTF